MSSASLKGKKCVVTGAAGFVGSHLVAALVEEGAQVVAVDLPLARLWEVIPEGVERIQADVRDNVVLEKAFDGASAVFHLAALTSVPGSIDSPATYHETNVDGTLAVLEAVRSVVPRARVVLTSSASVYGDQESPRAVEHLLANPQSPYALQKYINERTARLWSELYGIETVLLRPFNIYGPRMDPEGAYAGVVGRFVRLKSEGLPLSITGDGTQTRDFVHVRDIAAAYIAAAISESVGKGEVINVASGKSVSINELARLFGARVEYVSARTEIKDSEADISLASSLLSWSPTITLEEGIEALILSPASL